MKTSITLFLFLFSISTTLNAQLWELKEKLGSSDQEAADQLGISIAISDSFMIAGAWTEDHDEMGDNRISDAGSAYIYKLQPNGQWQGIQKVVSTSRSRSAYFGYAVDIDGDWALVGAFNEDTDVPGNQGQVYAYQRGADDSWNLMDTLKASDEAASNLFGKSLAISGNYALVGSPGNKTDENGVDSLIEGGAAYLFKWEANQGWQEIAKIVPEDRAQGDVFGSSVAIDGFGILISAIEKDESNINLRTGLVYGAKFNTATELEQIVKTDLQRIFASEVSGRDVFGNGLAISGDWAFLGAPAGASDDTGFGRANGNGYFYKWENGVWVEKQVAYPSDPDNSGDFGFAADMDGGIAIIGAASASSDGMNGNGVAAAGAAHIYELQGNDSWIEVDKIAGTERAFFDTFGGAVAVDGSKLSVGAWSADTIEGGFLIDGGALYSFERAWPLSLEEDAVFQDIRLISEANKSEIKLVNEGNWGETYRLSLLNLQASTIWEEEIRLNESWERNFEGLAAGIYIIRLEDAGKASKSWKWIR